MVTLLLAHGESGPALDQAKRIHKRCHTAASEALLLEAYLARIPALAERGVENEAKSLMQLVRERYPAYREKLRGVAALFISGGDGVNDLLQPLNDPDAPPGAGVAIAVRSPESDCGRRSGTGSALCHSRGGSLPHAGRKKPEGA